MNIKINDSQKERILESMNQLKELNNDVMDTCPIRYEQLCAMTSTVQPFPIILYL